MIYQAVLDALGGTPTATMQEWAYKCACAILVVGCWAVVKMADWLFKRY